MKNFVTKLACTYALLVTSLSFPLSANIFESLGIQAEYQEGLGYRQDSINWRFRDVDQVNPTARSNLHFKDLEILLLNAKFRGVVGSTFYVRGSFDYGWILDGSLHEKLTIDHQQDARHFNSNGFLTQGSFKKSVVHSKQKSNSYVWDVDIGFGLPYDWDYNSIQIAPMIGFSYNRQHIRMHNKGRFSSSSSFSESSEGIGNCIKGTTTFNASWWGPWIGLDFSYQVNCWTLFGEFELKIGRAERTRNGNLGLSYFDHYTRTKNFWGTTTRLGTNYSITENWYMEATLMYTHLASSQHRDTIYFSSGAVVVDAGYKF